MPGGAARCAIPFKQAAAIQLLATRSPPLEPSLPDPPAALIAADKYSVAFEDDKFRIGGCSIGGDGSARGAAHCIALELPTLVGIHSDEAAVLGVFDGHGGRRIADAAAANVVSWVSRTEAFRQHRFGDSLRAALSDGDRELQERFPTDPSGCAAAVMLSVQGTLWCAAVGDSRIFMSRGGLATELTPSGSSGIAKSESRDERLLLGEAPAKAHFGRVVDPVVFQVELTREDEFAVLASGSVWQSLPEQRIFDFLRTQLNEHGDPTLALEHLLDRCLQRAREAEISNFAAILVHFKSSFLRLYAHRGSPLEVAAIVPRRDFHVYSHSP